METNFLAPINFLSEIANKYEKIKSGTILVDSVAEEGSLLIIFMELQNLGLLFYLV